MNYYNQMPYFIIVPRQNMPYMNNNTQMYPPMPTMQQPMPALPSSIPSAPMPVVPDFTEEGVQPLQEIQPAPETVENSQYVPGYLKSQIGKQVRVEFLVGSTAPLVDRIGTLIGVGASYILIRPVGTDDTLLCDMYSIKFITFYY